MSIISNEISKAIELLNQEQLVAIPTETVYGLAGNIYSEKAVKAIFEMKKRPLFNPLIAHFQSLEQLETLATEIPDKAYHLASKFWPGSLTLVLKKHKKIPDLITAGKDTVAVRIPNHPLTLELLKNLDFPLAAPSANPFGSISPTNAQHVYSYFKNNLPLILDGGDCINGIESTIVGFENDKPIIYRLGSLAVEEIENEIGSVQILNNNENNPTAPGMLSKHYAPKTDTFLTDNIEEIILKNKNKKIGVITFNKFIDDNSINHIEVLSKTSDFKEATSNLYAAMHRLDGMNLDMIIIEKFPDYDLGKSINDRLKRATKNEKLIF